MDYSELDTPALLIDLDRMERNISGMADLARRHIVALRPHTKTHKCPDIAKIQIENGAVGITCAKIGEAEVMVRAGVTDIVIANEVIGEQKYRRLLALLDKANVCVAVDSEFGANGLNAALAAANLKIDVMVEVNCGQDRSGVLPGEHTLQIARYVQGLPQLRLRGLLTHGGQAYNKGSIAEIAEVGQHEGQVLVETADLLRKNGIEVSTVSVGSTPTVNYCSSVPGVTEIRPGTYVFNDLTQVELFASKIKDCALSVLATVTSKPAADRVILDTGKKSLTADTAGRLGHAKGFGLIPAKNTVISRLSEEHGVIISETDFTIGEKVRIIPNHACVVVNMFEAMYGVRGQEVERTFTVAGRGKVH